MPTAPGCKAPLLPAAFGWWLGTGTTGTGVSPGSVKAPVGGRAVAHPKPGAGWVPGV